MAPHPIPIALTYEDYLDFPDDGRRHEILAGDHVMEPAPSPIHQLVVIRLVQALANFLDRVPLGRVLAAPLDVILSPADVVQPDVCLVRRLHLITERGVEGAPDLVIEVLSPSTRGRDAGAKLRTYAKHGVAEYWRVDPDERRVEVSCWTESGYRPEETRRLDSAALITTPLLPGFELPLAALFADLDGGGR